MSAPIAGHDGVHSRPLGDGIQLCLESHRSRRRTAKKPSLISYEVDVKTPDKPQDESRRLSTLRSLNVLDTPHEERFDRLARMAKRMFNVAFAVVSLVDENRQWFKSCIGLDATETSRDVSFCGHAILEDGVFVIEDALADPRFSDNPLVVDEPSIRFYAGCPLKALNGSKLGTLCVIDTEPRVFSEEDRFALADLASMVESELVAIELATQDELTSVLNRRGFMMLAQHSINLALRDKAPVTLVFFDLNQFKPINDRFGHLEGDRALILFTELLVEVTRESDLCARLGGDEFVVLLFGSDVSHADALMGRLRERLAEVNRDFELGYAIEFAAGVVEFDAQRHRSLEALLIEGDRRMYRQKNREPDHKN